MIGSGIRWRRLGVALTGVLLAGVLASCGSSDAAATGYLLPWAGGQSHQVMQGPLVVDAHGRAAPPVAEAIGTRTGSMPGISICRKGTPVLAARGGTVGLVVGSWSADHCGGVSPVADQPPGYVVNELMGNQANLVRIDHGDGTSALYLHLRAIDPVIEAKVKSGEPVAQGERLGLSGKTGMTGCVPHLHFQVETTVRADWYTTSLPINFADPDVLAHSPDGVPAEGARYISGNAPTS